MLFCFLFFSVNCFSAPGLHNDVSSSQQSTSNLTIPKKNSIYFELLGNGIIYSFGYDRLIITKDLYKISTNIGLTAIPASPFSSDFQVYTISPQLSFLIGQKNNLELGLGYTMALLKSDSEINNILVYRIGYRYQKKDGGLFFRIGFTPFSFIKKSPDFFNNYLYFQPWGGITIGWTF